VATKFRWGKNLTVSFVLARQTNTKSKVPRNT